MLSLVLAALTFLQPSTASCSCTVGLDGVITTVCERRLPDGSYERVRDLDDGLGNARTFMPDGSIVVRRLGEVVDVLPPNR